MNFRIINYDGYCVGFCGYFSETWLEFETLEEAIDIARHWDNWIAGMDER